MAATVSKPKGRPKGAKNRYSASAKENIAAVFTRLGGTDGMARWAMRNRKEFYRIYARLLPVEVDAALSGSITVIRRDPRERPPDYQRRTKVSPPHEP